ncbi:MAG: N(5)-(carboxyethyl)ornithine synthase, partial [Bacteroidales bacterium]|nr:N(5)-(carboxyethyl)ornithine synthase [Bacteroidales bacterium]
VQHALLNYGMYPDSSTKVAILSSGNVAQGTFAEISNYNPELRMFYRKTMHEFYESLGDYDIIINGIEVDEPNKHIITKEHLKQLKRPCLLIDAAADAGNAIEGTHYTTIEKPIYKEDGLYFYEVNNAPSLIFRKSSYEISKSFSENIFKKDISNIINLI